MKLAQLKILRALVQNNCNVSVTAEEVCLVQSAVSRHIQLLEREFGEQLFERNGKRLVKPTPLCLAILKEIGSITQAENNITRLVDNAANATNGVLRIATTHTQARYFLPEVFRVFREQYPDVELVLRQGDPTQLVQMLRDQSADIAVCTEELAKSDDLYTETCYSWGHCVVVLADHPLAKRNKPLTIADLEGWGLITYSHQYTGGSQIRECFRKAGVKSNIVFAASDTDIIKTYVRLRMGIGIVAAMSIDAKDTDLVALQAQHLFGVSITRVARRKSAVLPSFTNRCWELMISRGQAIERMVAGNE